MSVDIDFFFPSNITIKVCTFMNSLRNFTSFFFSFFANDSNSGDSSFLQFTCSKEVSLMEVQYFADILIEFFSREELLMKVQMIPGTIFHYEAEGSC